MTTPNHCCTPGIAATLLAVAVQTAATPALTAEPVDLTAAEISGYRQWLATVDQNLDTPPRIVLGERASALRNAIADDDSAAIDTLLAQFSPPVDELTDATRYWFAFALAYRQRWADSLTQLRRLLVDTVPPRSLGVAESAWAVTAVADHYFLLGGKRQARELYAILTGSERQAVSRWAEYQLANLDLLAADYQRAATTFARLCAAPATDRWQEHACAMAEVARKLNQTRVEVEPYGTAAYDRR